MIVKGEDLNILSPIWKLHFLFVDNLTGCIPRSLVAIRINNYTIELLASRLKISTLISVLKNSLIYNVSQLIDIIAVDTPGQKSRFELSYLFLSYPYNTRFRLVIKTNELLPCLTLTSYYIGALWPERELWDMFGILIIEHPDFRRISTDYSFRGFPLRKDYPLSGYIELYYDDTEKKIITNQVSFAQEYRHFNFQNPWRKRNLNV